MISGYDFYERQKSRIEHFHKRIFFRSSDFNHILESIRTLNTKGNDGFCSLYDEEKDG